MFVHEINHFTQFSVRLIGRIVEFLGYIADYGRRNKFHGLIFIVFHFDIEPRTVYAKSSLIAQEITLHIGKREFVRIAVLISARFIE